MTKKILSLVLAMMMVIGVFAGITVAEEAAPVVLELGISNLSANEDKDWYPDMWIARINEKLGVDIRWTKYDDDMMTLALAGGDLKDVMMFKPQPVLEAGAALNLDPYLEQYGPNISKYTLRNDLLRKYVSGGDNCLYFHTPNTGYEDVTGAQEGWNGYLVRWDLYAELGYPEMNSYEDWINVIEQMVALYPQNENGEQTYGMGIWNDSGLWGWEMGAVSNMGFTTIANWTLAWDTKTNELVNYLTETDLDKSAHWKNMWFFNQLYRKGLFDPDSFAMTSDELSEKYANNRYVSGICTWYVGDLYAANRDIDPNTTAGIIAVPVKGGSGWYGQNAIIGWGGKNMFINRNIDEAKIPYAMGFIDYLDSDEGNRANYSGQQGIHWDYDDQGVPYIFEETTALKSAGGDEWKKQGIGQQANIIGSSAWGVAEDGYYYDLRLYDLASGLNPLQKAFCEHYGVSYPGELRYNWEQAGEAYSQKYALHTTIDSLIAATPDDITTIQGRISEMMIRYIKDIVTAESDEAFADVQSKFIADVTDAGLPEVYDYWNENYNGLAQEILAIMDAQ